MSKDFVALQIPPVSFLDEGLEPVLDFLKEKARVNALLYWVHAIETMQRPKSYAGHGVEGFKRFEGGSFWKTHPEYYANTCLPPWPTPDPAFAGRDWLEEVVGPAKERGIDVYAWVYENPYGDSPKQIPNWPKVLEIDCYGRKAHMPCFNNPDYANWFYSITEDLVKSYDIAGVVWGSERNGPLGRALLASHDKAPMPPGCFCDHCLAKAERRGINAERAKAGYRLLWEMAESARSDSYQKPVDGHFVSFIRLLLQYPEILAWDNLWVESQQDVRRGIYGTVKAIDASKKVGWHLWHLESFDPIYRSEIDHTEMVNFSDWLKPIVYHNCAGIRHHTYMHKLQQTVLRDMPVELAYKFVSAVLGLAEAPLQELPEAGFSSEYVYRETKRCVDAVKGRIPVYPGVELDIPTYLPGKATGPEDVIDAIKASYRGGASGVVISRDYAEMQWDNLEAVGRALVELGKA